MMKGHVSITLLVFGLLLALSVAYIALAAYVNVTLFSSLEQVQESGAPLADVLPLFNQTLAKGFLFLLVILTAFFLTSAILLLRFVIFPVKRLKQAFRKMTEGNLDISVQPEGVAELRHITAGLNDATRTLREQTAALAAAKSDLEAVNAKLQEEYTQAKKLNDLTVGRELTMIKMKEELAQLRASK